MKIEYVSRKSRRIIAAALAMLMSVSVFAQTLPRFSAAEGVSGSDVAAAAGDAEVVTVEIPAEETEAQMQIDETVSIVKTASPSDAALTAPAAAVSAADASDAAASATDVSESDLTLSPEFSAERKINGWTVSVYAPEGVIPEGAELRITNVNGALRDKAEAVADVEFDILVDVTLFANGEEIQPDTENGLVQVSLTKDGAVSGSFELYHFNEAVTDVEILDTEIDGDTAKAEVEHFSLIGGDGSIDSWTSFVGAVEGAAAGDEIKLDGDIVRDADATAITISKNLTIDLNGHKISSTSDYKNNGNLFTMSGSSELRVTVKNGTIDGFKNNGDGGAFYLSGSSLYLTLNGVTIQNCASANSGGAVYAFGGSPRVFVYVSGSVLKNCTATGTLTTNYPMGGGAIMLMGATLEITDTTITGCSATNCAGGISANFDSLVLSYDGVDIYGNSADWVGGMSLISSQWILSYDDCKIHGNSSSDATTDVFVLSPPIDGAVYFTSNASQVSPIYISLEEFNKAFCKQTGYMDYQSLFVSTVPHYVVRKLDKVNGLGLVNGRRVVVDPEMKNGTVTVQPWYDGDYGINVSDFTSTTGGTVSFSVTPAAGYELDKLYYVEYGDDAQHDIDKTETKFNMPATDVTIYATFKGIEYTLTVDSPISNGTVTANSKYKTGDTVSLTVTPATGYKLDTLYYKVAGDTTEYPIDGTSFTMPAGNTTVYATFIQDHVHDLVYAGGGMTNTIKAFCKDEECPLIWDKDNLPALTVTAPDAEYTGLPYAGLSIDDKLTSVINDTYSVLYTSASGTTYSSADAPIEIGSYKVKVSLDKANQNNATAVASFKITKPSQTITLTPNVTEIEMTVGDTDKKLTYTLTKGDGELSCSIDPSTGLEIQADGTLVATVGGSAGSPAEYTITVKAAETDACKETTATVKVKVTKKTQTISGDTEIKDLAVGSDPIALSSKNVKTNAEGNTLTYTVTEGSDCITVDKSGNITAVKPGTAKIKVSAAAYGDYDAAEDLVITVIVVKGTQTISGSETMTVYYGGDLTDPTKPIKLDAVLEKTDAEGKLSYVSSSTGVCEVTEDGTLTIKNPGTVKITVSAAATTLYNAPTDKEITVTINPRPLTITVNNKSARVGEAMPAFDYVAPTLVGSDTLPVTFVKFTCNAPVSDDKLTTAGSYDITAEITNAKFLSKYVVTFTEAKLAVTKHDHVWQYELNDACDTALAYCTKEEDKCDYYGKDNALKFTLKVPAVHTGATSLVYDGEAFPVVYDGEENAKFIAECGLGTIDPATDITYYCGADVSHDAPVNAGTYTAMLNIPKANGEGNLNIGAPSKCQYVEFTIAKGEQTIETGADVTMTIGETGKAVTASVTKGDGALSYTVSPSTELTVDPANGALTATAAGEYIVTAKAAGTANYNEATCADTIKVTVNKKEQTITVPAETITVTYGTPVDIGASAQGELTYVDYNTNNFTVSDDGKVTFVKPDSIGSTVTVKAAETDTYKAAEKKINVITKPAELTMAFDDSDPNYAYAGETAEQAIARINGKVTGLVGEDKLSDVGSIIKKVQNATSTAKLDNSDELLATGNYKYMLQFSADGSKKDCYTVDPAQLVRDTAITVSKRDQTLTPAEDTVYIKVGGSGSVSATASETPITGVTALPAAKLGTVTYAIKGTSSIVTAVDAATGALTLSDDEGSATIVVTAAGNDYYNEATPVEITVVVSKKLDPEPEVGYWETVYMGETDRPVSVNTKSDGAVTISISDGNSISLTPASDGKSADITILAPGITKVHVKIAETDNYALFEQDYEIEVKKRDQTVTADNVTFYAGEDKSVSATVAETPVSGVTALSGQTGDLSYSVADETVVKIDATTGKLEFVAEGTATVTITAAENTIYNEGTKTITVTAHKREQTITANDVTFYAGEDKSVSASVAEKAVDGVSALLGKTGALSYSVADETVVKVDAATGELEFVAAGTAKVTVTAAGNDFYKEQTKDITVTASKRTQKVEADDMTITDADSGVKLEPTVSEVAKSGVPALLDKTAKPVFVSSDESIATVDENGVITVKGTGKVTISMTLPENEFYNAVNEPVDITLTIEELSVIEGIGGKYKVGSKEGLTFRSNGVYDHFIGVQVDDKDVAASNYTAWEGSTYVKFTTKYLDSLATGKHKLTYLFTNGKCSCDFYVERPSGGSGDNPKTGDSENIALWANLLLVSALTVVFIMLGRKKKGVSLHK